MKEEPIEVERNTVDYSVGQRPIHEAYEPPNPIPQFRPRPKLHQAQPTTRKRSYPTITTQLTQSPGSEVSAGSRAADSKKSS